jgi:putative endonuclease
LCRARRRWKLSEPSKTTGFRGERAAEKFLKRRGYKIVARGLRSRGGELDLVAVDGRTIVFVEVKTRTSDRYGAPEEAVDLNKQKRMTRAALMFLKRHGLLECSCRFDVVAVSWPAGSKRPTIEHFENAFEAVGVGGMFG